MADVQHNALTSTDLHECKGADSASASTVRVADGAGSGGWQKITTSELNTSSIFNVNERSLNITLDDVSTASIVYVPVPWNCTLTAVYTALGAAITGADSTVTIKNNTGTSAGTITVSYSGSAAGDIDSAALVTNNTFTTGQKVIIETDGASSTTAKLYITLVFTRTS